MFRIITSGNVDKFETRRNLLKQAEEVEKTQFLQRITKSQEIQEENRILSRRLEGADSVIVNVQTYIDALWKYLDTPSLVNAEKIILQKLKNLQFFELKDDEVFEFLNKEEFYSFTIDNNILNRIQEETKFWTVSNAVNLVSDDKVILLDVLRKYNKRVKAMVNIHESSSIIVDAFSQTVFDNSVRAWFNGIGVSALSGSVIANIKKQIDDNNKRLDDLNNVTNDLSEVLSSIRNEIENSPLPMNNSEVRTIVANAGKTVTIDLDVRTNSRIGGLKIGARTGDNLQSGELRSRIPPLSDKTVVQNFERGSRIVSKLENIVTNINANYANLQQFQVMYDLIVSLSDPSEETQLRAIRRDIPPGQSTQGTLTSIITTIQNRYVRRLKTYTARLKNENNKRYKTRWDGADRLPYLQSLRDRGFEIEVYADDSRIGKIITDSENAVSITPSHVVIPSKTKTVSLRFVARSYHTGSLMLTFIGVTNAQKLIGNEHIVDYNLVVKEMCSRCGNRVAVLDQPVFGECEYNVTITKHEKRMLHDNSVPDEEKEKIRKRVYQRRNHTFYGYHGSTNLIVSPATGTSKPPDRVRGVVYPVGENSNRNFVFHQKAQSRALGFPNDMDVVSYEPELYTHFDPTDKSIEDFLIFFSLSYLSELQKYYTDPNYSRTLVPLFLGSKIGAPGSSSKEKKIFLEPSYAEIIFLEPVLTPSKSIILQESFVDAPHKAETDDLDDAGIILSSVPSETVSDTAIDDPDGVDITLSSVPPETVSDTSINDPDGADITLSSVPPETVSDTPHRVMIDDPDSDYEYDIDFARECGGPPPPVPPPPSKLPESNLFDVESSSDEENIFDFSSADPTLEERLETEIKSFTLEFGNKSVAELRKTILDLARHEKTLTDLVLELNA